MPAAANLPVWAVVLFEAARFVQHSVKAPPVCPTVVVPDSHEGTCPDVHTSCPGCPVCPSCPSLECAEGTPWGTAAASALGAGAWWVIVKAGAQLVSRWTVKPKNGRGAAPARRGGGVVA